VPRSIRRDGSTDYHNSHAERMAREGAGYVEFGWGTWNLL